MSVGVGAQTCDPSIEATAPASRFDINGDGTVTDRKTGLMWKQCLEGLSGIDCTGTASTTTWEVALSAAEDSTFAGYNDWRLPNIKELASIVERKCMNPAINLSVFPVSPGFAWSSTPRVNYPEKVWGIQFSGSYSQGENLGLNRTKFRYIYSGGSDKYVYSIFVRSP
ncbi:Lcl C-terminal domain-containing protein [Candidatus Venteria ishoeyi]|uniref:Lcl C-terminal domain-containing protein n=1 Tax=Candidatus Venteria ishoeyi TaxID=1899563 RepID=UPI0015B12A77|nr:DUF1566 domain-containing protein [Candidatus Venteria ishoeyi]